MTDLPAPWLRALDRRRRLFDPAAPGACMRLLHDEDAALRCDRFGRVCWFYWYREGAPRPADLARLDAFAAAAGAAHWHLRSMPDRGRDPGPGPAWSSPGAPETWTAVEEGLRFRLRAGAGPSPGLFLDQRRNRAWVRDRARGARVLNLFAFTGSFGIAALAGGAREVVQNDVSRAHLARARENAALNGLADRHGAAFQTTGLGSILTMHLQREPIRSIRDIRPRDARLRQLLHLDLIDKGFFTARRGYMAPCLPITQADCGGLIEAVDEFLAHHGHLLGAAPDG